jgi:hypothetical protein
MLLIHGLQEWDEDEEWLETEDIAGLTEDSTEPRAENAVEERQSS